MDSPNKGKGMSKGTWWEYISHPLKMKAIAQMQGIIVPDRVFTGSWSRLTE